MNRGVSLSYEGDAPRTRLAWPVSGGQWKGGWGLFLLPVAVVLAVVLGEGATSPEGQAAVAQRAAPVPSDMRIALAFGPGNQTAALAANDGAIALAQERVANGPGQWLRQESEAAALLQRFALVHDYADLQHASTILDEAQANAPAGSGPWLRAAGAAMLRHDLAGAEHALDGADGMAVPLSRADRAEIMAMRGDIALYRGNMAGADYLYREAFAIDGASLQHYRRAVLARAQGRFDDARELFSGAALSGDTPRLRAQIAMQIGRTESAQGRYASAGAWYREAENLFAQSPMGAALQAEALALSGNTVGAIAAMERAAAVHRWPEMMDALAMMYRLRGERGESRRWAARAGKIWNDRLAQAPLAAQAHAAEHELAFGDARRALQLARANLAARPYGEARILMANALIANGKPEAALQQLRRAESEGWRSAPMFAAMAEAAAMTGDDETMQDASAKAKAINPRIFEPETRLAWFGHG